jgi:hypothetical protein
VLARKLLRGIGDELLEWQLHQLGFHLGISRTAIIVAILTFSIEKKFRQLSFQISTGWISVHCWIEMRVSLQLFPTSAGGSSVRITIWRFRTLRDVEKIDLRRSTQNCQIPARYLTFRACMNMNSELLGILFLTTD